MTNSMTFRASDARMIVADGQLTLSGGGMTGGFSSTVMREGVDRGVYGADIYVLAGDTDAPEIAVRFVAENDDIWWAKHVIVNWALATGYVRVWFDDEMYDLTDEVPPAGEVSVVCPTCFTRWVERDLDFWIHVRNARCFPSACPNCRSTMPQWTVGKVTAENAA